MSSPSLTPWIIGTRDDDLAAQRLVGAEALEVAADDVGQDADIVFMLLRIHDLRVIEHVVAQLRQRAQPLLRAEAARLDGEREAASADLAGQLDGVVHMREHLAAAERNTAAEDS